MVLIGVHRKLEKIKKEEEIGYIINECCLLRDRGKRQTNKTFVNGMNLIKIYVTQRVSD